MMSVLRTLAPRQAQTDETMLPPDAPMPQEQRRGGRDVPGELEVSPSRGETVGMEVLLPPGWRVRMSLRTALPAAAARGSADVWRIVEHTAGRITGGVTIIVQAK